MGYLGKLEEDNHQDVWVAATSPSFIEYNASGRSPESQCEFIRSLDAQQRYALVSFLLDSEVPSGGIHGLFSCMGLLLPQIKESLEFYTARNYLSALAPLFSLFDLESYPQDYDMMMETWESILDSHFDLVERTQIMYWGLCESHPLRSTVESHITTNMDLYFEPA